MLHQSLRLRRDRDIKQVLSRGRPAKSYFLRMKFWRNGLTSHRWAFVVSNKIAKRATVRNRIKRQLRAIISLNLDKFLQVPHFDIVVLASGQITQKKYQQIREDFERLLRQARLLPVEDQR